MRGARGKPRRPIDQAIAVKKSADRFWDHTFRTLEPVSNETRTSLLNAMNLTNTADENYYHQSYLERMKEILKREKGHFCHDTF